MNSSQIEKNLRELEKNFSKESFIFDLLLAYGTPKATITLLKKGRHNLSKRDDQIILKKKLFFQEVKNEDLHAVIDDLQKDKTTMRHNPRFIIVTDYQTLLAMDTKTKDQPEIKIKSIAKHYDFFLPWAGIEKHKHTNENDADRRAAVKMAKLYDGILADNQISDKKRTHDLNIFLSRLLFCFFAEDTNIFEDQFFTNSLASHAQADGNDLHEHLEKIFDVLSIKEEKRNKSLPEFLEKFPWVNGGLFAEKHWIPKFSKTARNIIIECGELNWKKINPDIFGSMIQAVMHPSERGSLGMHYTSVPNIMKVIEPLFLNELRGEFKKHRGNKKKLDALRIRISKMKFFDPACGSGNFLIITYKELRRLEMEIIEEMGQFAFSDIHLNQFFGIEIDGFASEIAKLSLYLAEHQMNTEFKDKFGKVLPTLPLKESGNIFCKNALRVDWQEVCPKNEGGEIFVFGNPPYLGSRNQDKEQKEDMEEVFQKDYKSLDYISCWFVLGAKYIQNNNAKLAFVSTNSICQGEQVALLWLRVLNENLEIFFAHQSFKWENNAKGNAGVTVVIVGIRNVSNEPKLIFKDGVLQSVKNINPYLTGGNSVSIRRKSKPLSKDFPNLVYGSLLNDGGNLTLIRKDKENIEKSYKDAQIFIKKYVGAREFLRGEERWCLKINDNQLGLANSIPEIKKRLDKISEMRAKSTEASTRKIAKTPHKYYFSAHKDTDSIIVPRTSSERREYIPIGFLNSDTIISDAAQAIYDAKPWIFGVISSQMHMTWVRAVAGRLKTDYRYSSALCYNTFPIPPLTTKQKETLTRHVYTILEEREKHSEKTMAQLYDPDKMPADLLEAHQSLDLAVERIYRSRPFGSDEERLEYLFKLYEKMIAEEKAK